MFTLADAGSVFVVIIIGHLRSIERLGGAGKVLELAWLRSAWVGAEQ
jgi:hypothetical protein